MIRVNELFPTIQGEGRWSGTPATFIRTQGCAVGCPWCDTKHTWPDGNPRKQVATEEVLAKAQSSPTWAYMTEDRIVAAVLDWVPRHFVITGGEPCAQDIYELTVQLGRHGRVQIETSGTYPINVSADTWATVSPKLDMPGGLPVLDSALDRADEIKFPVTGRDDIANLAAILDHNPARRRAVIALQPVSQDHEATRLCIEACMVHNWQLSLQTHKVAAIR